MGLRRCGDGTASLFVVCLGGRSAVPKQTEWTR